MNYMMGLLENHATGEGSTIEIIILNYIETHKDDYGDLSLFLCEKIKEESIYTFAKLMLPKVFIIKPDIPLKEILGEFDYIIPMIPEFIVYNLKNEQRCIFSYYTKFHMNCS